MKVLSAKSGLPAIGFLFVFSLYLFTLSPTINFGDSPELVAAACNLDIAHPPGYPLFSLTAGLFTYLPFGNNPAEKINMASAFFSAAALFVLAFTLSTKNDVLSAWGPFFTLLILALTPALWSQSVISEVYSLNLLIFSILFYLSLEWWKKGDIRLLFAAAFIFGLGLANHHTLLVFGPALIVLFLSRRHVVGFKHYSYGLCFFILGLATYIYLPVRSHQALPIDWGNPERYGAFMEVLLRRQFPTWEKGIDMKKVFDHLTFYSKTLYKEFSIYFLVTGYIGSIRFFKFGRGPFLLSFYLFIACGAGTLLFLNPSKDTYADVYVMLIPSLAVFAVWTGYGIRDILIFCSERKSGAYLASLFIVLLLALTAYKGYGSFRQNNLKNRYFAFDYADNILKSVDRDGIIFVEADTALFPLWYLQYVEGKRSDVAVIDVDFLMLPWFRRQITERYGSIEFNMEDLDKHSAGLRSGKNLFEVMDAFKVSQLEKMTNKLLGERPIYISYEFGPVFAKWSNKEKTVVTDQGLLYQISDHLVQPDVQAWDSYNLRSVVEYFDDRDPYIVALSTAYLKSLERRATVLLQKGDKDAAGRILKRIREIRVKAAPYF